MRSTIRAYGTGRDATLMEAKSVIQRQSREFVSSGRLAQVDLFFIRPDRARRAVVSLKA